jgi:hypothetical protein
MHELRMWSVDRIVVTGGELILGGNPVSVPLCLGKYVSAIPLSSDPNLSTPAYELWKQTSGKIRVLYCVMIVQS